MKAPRANTAGRETGLGLSIAHGIIKDYGGTVTVDSTVGQGTTFRISLPVIQGETALVVEKPAEVRQGKERILFIDDEEVLTRMGKVMLERLGYHVTVQHSSLEALEGESGGMGFSNRRLRQS